MSGDARMTQLVLLPVAALARHDADPARLGAEEVDDPEGAHRDVGLVVPDAERVVGRGREGGRLGAVVDDLAGERRVVVGLGASGAPAVDVAVTSRPRPTAALARRTKAVHGSGSSVGGGGGVRRAMRASVNPAASAPAAGATGTPPPVAGRRPPGKAGADDGGGGGGRGGSSGRRRTTTGQHVGRPEGGRVGAAEVGDALGHGPLHQRCDGERRVHAEAGRHHGPVEHGQALDPVHEAVAIDDAGVGRIAAMRAPPRG